MNLKECNLYGMKSHNCLVFIQTRIPIAYRYLLLKGIWDALTKIWNSPFPRGCSLDFLWVGNLSLRECTQNQSPGWKITCLCPLLALVAYTWFLFSICCRTLLSSTTGKWIKSMRVKGLNPYTISNGENPIVECTLRLYANSMNDK